MKIDWQWKRFREVHHNDNDFSRTARYRELLRYYPWRHYLIIKFGSYIRFLISFIGCFMATTLDEIKHLEIYVYSMAHPGRPLVIEIHPIVDSVTSRYKLKYRSIGWISIVHYAWVMLCRKWHLQVVFLQILRNVCSWLSRSNHGLHIAVFSFCLKIYVGYPAACFYRSFAVAASNSRHVIHDIIAERCIDNLAI